MSVTIETIRRNLRDVEGDALRTRMSAVANLKDFLVQPNVVRHLDEQLWRQVFESLFLCFYKEKAHAEKKEVAAPMKRMESVADVIRTIVDHAYTHLLSKSVKTIIDGAMKNMRNQGNLIPGVGLSFLKILTCLVQHGPHADHLPRDKWTSLVERAFNILLGDSLTYKFSYDTPEENDPDDSNIQSSSKRRKLQNSRRIVSASPEQMQCGELLVALMRIPSANDYILNADTPQLASSILHRLYRYLELYSKPSSDYLKLLLAALSHIALNRRHATVDFARKAWQHLTVASVWGMKESNMLPDLISVLHVLYPFITATDPDDTYAWTADLWDTLDRMKDAPGCKWSEFSIDSLRLSFSDLLSGDDEEERKDGAFVARSFRVGQKFGHVQAFLWTALKLQADAVAKLYLLRESMVSVDRSRKKRSRLNQDKDEHDPMSEILKDIELNSVLAFQRLLFIIDYHWSVLHGDLQRRLITLLLGALQVDNSMIQSWAFLCIASIAHADCLESRLPTSGGSSTDRTLICDQMVWETIWTNCHATALLLHVDSHTHKFTHPPLHAPHILADIETLTKDLEVQGPNYPYDSVCSFLSRCLVMASQDIRCWKLGRIVEGEMPCYMVKDLIHLLETVCGFSRRTDVVCRAILPVSELVQVVEQEKRTQVIRDFLLDAKLPQFVPSNDGAKASPSYRSEPLPQEIALLAMGHRQRRLSKFMLELLEHIHQKWKVRMEAKRPHSATGVRLCLDFAVIAFCFQCSLIHNGMQLDILTIKEAGKVIALLLPLLRETPWTTAEKAVVIQALEPLISTEEPRADDIPFVDLLPPDINSGIRARVLQDLVSDPQQHIDRKRSSRMDFQRIIWRTLEADHLQVVKATMLDMLRILAGHQLQEDAMDVDFGPVRTGSRQLSDWDDCCQREPTRDNELSSIVLGCKEDHSDRFILLCSVLGEKFRCKTLHLGVEDLKKFLAVIVDLSDKYPYTRDEKYQLLVGHFLESILLIWIPINEADGPNSEHGGQLLSQMARALKVGVIKSWKVRDTLVRLYDRFVTIPNDVEASPDTLLPFVGGDCDIRVRFRAAVANAHLFSFAQKTERDPNSVYASIKGHYVIDLDDYEGMLTRMLSLANIIIVSSAARRLSYWHLIEPALFEDTFSTHIEAILRSVTQRLGLASPSQLFEAYGSSLAYSIIAAKKDGLTFPPHILGYSDRKECAFATFPLFTPSNVLAETAGDPATAVLGQRQFENHCKVIQKPIADGIRDCFGDIVGQHLLSKPPSSSPDEGTLDTLLLQRTRVESATLFYALLASKLDTVVSAILCTMLDYDVSPTGAIVTALRSLDVKKTGKRAQIFIALVEYRTVEDFITHQPTLPCYTVSTILHCLEWLRGTASWKEHEKALTYHVLQDLFAGIEKSFLVNEQVRFMNSICVWVAYLHEVFDNATLLHVLMRGAISLMRHSDLARGAQSILNWSFTMYRQQAQTNRRFPDILIRELGHDLRQWIDEQALMVAQVAQLEYQVLLALPAWSHRPEGELAELYTAIGASSVSHALNDNAITSNKFRLVVRLGDHANRNEYDEDEFANRDFWRLKESIPKSNRLNREDVDAFANLLIWNKGLIRGFGSDLSTSGRKRETSRADPFVAIISSLLKLLGGSDVSRRHTVYRTLRAIAGVAEFSAQDKGFAEEVGYLQDFPFDPISRPTVDINELSSEAYLESSKDFASWIGLICTLLSDLSSSTNAYFAQISPVLKSDALFAEDMLPILVQYLLQRTDHQMYRETLSRYFESILRFEYAAMPCVRSIIDIVLHLRQIPPPQPSSDLLGYNKWLTIDFVLLARNAITCGSYTTALLFLELAAENGSRNLAEDALVEQIMYHIYSNIDEPDGFYGIKPLDLRKFLINCFHHENQWDKAFRFHGAALEAGSKNPRDMEGLLQSIHSFGFNHLANTTSQNFYGDTSTCMNYQLGWRTETWDLPEREQEQSSDASLYFALRAIHVQRDQEVGRDVVRLSMFREMERLRNLGSENVAQIREVIQNLVCLYQISQWTYEPFPTLVSSKDTDLRKWAPFTVVEPGIEFRLVESIMATRVSIVRSVRRREERQQMGDMTSDFIQTLREVEKQCLLHVSQVARREQQVQIALNSVIRAETLVNPVTFDVSEEFACVLWAQNEEKRAVEFLRGLRDSQSAPLQDASKLAAMNACLGTWTAEACLEKPSVIWRDFFLPASEIIANCANRTNSDSCAAVYHACAIFAAQQYQAIVKSPDSIRLKVYVQRKQQEIENRTSQRSRSGAELRELEKAKLVLEHDTAHYGQILHERGTFLEHAITMYARCLIMSDQFDDDAPIRLCSLWLANFDQENLQAAVAASIRKVPSRKFLFLAHQLSARLSYKDGSDAQQTLKHMMMRMCTEHPFHSLYQVFCLKTETGGTTKTTSSQREIWADRRAAAIDIFKKLSTNNQPNIVRRTQDVNILCEASVGWATYGIKNDPKYAKSPHKDGHFPLPNVDGLKILKLAGPRNGKHLDAPIMTAHIPIDLTMKYESCPWFNHFETVFYTAGGINLPKITTCFDIHGKPYKQLFKGEGNDDLRQDAVMEQVFDLVNVVLDHDRETKRRNLHVRSYKVIPLSSQAGVLEFVLNTSPMRSWLVPAHSRYGPKMSKGGPAAQLGKAQAKNDLQGILAEFNDIVTRHPPVMRHYFTERHKSPTAWFTMRLNYTRSVATTSIVGHVLGLGDRHTSNILMDNSSGAVVHIDLGIAFDQGKLLRVPERVPFRMTPDMVDGMGIAGTNGVFQRCAEETLRVLREGSDVIMTILEVFRYDPLHTWTMSDYKVKAAQPTDSNPNGNTIMADQMHKPLMGIGIDMSSGGAEEAADRALSGVARKLEKTLSVASTVSGLVTEAKDPENLSQMFPGWQPWL
ncbi:uncharacterized protein EV420DRAFT_1636079 [Desarmillaria tabescens]|uniref:Serine/threonine-protein kinase Tel1 n=1 Tax=Armillaria tabescens TaxID=1929756 RepID=A0AA39NK22_ARMTA|nr:uncharacterized protein EV420DRAFT_1636079 [Desarmillaria tabescens]KAK0467046.1 hypothetical protein EV420DRAFT_1636079 [Desarmillaria tabescens]